MTKGGGKTVLGVQWLFLQCVQLIKQFKLPRTKYPVPLAFMGRKRSVDFTRTTLATWKAFIPQEAYTINEQKHEIVIDNRVKIDYGGFDDSNTIKKFNSAEYVYIFADQAEELTRDDYGLVAATLRRKINGITPPFKMLMTCNPSECWLKPEYIVSPASNKRFIKSLPADNPFLAAGYVENLKDSFKHRPELLRAYLYGSWDDLSSSDTVIKGAWIDQCVNKSLTRINTKRIVSIDPADMGDDETVIYAFENERIIDTEILSQSDPMINAGHAVKMLKKWKANLITGDCIGVGSGVFSRLRELGEPASGLNVAEESSRPDKYFDLRAEMWWEVGEMFANGMVSIPDDPILRMQLAVMKYTVHSDGVIQLVPSKETKKALSGKSPDRAVACVMGLYALRNASVIGDSKEWKTSYKEDSNKELTHMAA